MNLEREWVERLKEDVVIPKKVQEKTGQAYYKIRRQAHIDPHLGEPKIGNRGSYFKKFAVGAAVLTVVCATATLGAKAILKWNDDFAKQHEVDEGLQSKLSEAGTTAVMEEEQTIEGVTVKAVQSIASGNYAYLMFEVSSEKELPAADLGAMFNDVNAVDADGGEISLSASFSSEKNKSGALIYEVMLQSVPVEGVSFNGRKVTVTLKDIVIEGVEPTLIQEGTWTFPITLPEKDASSVYELNQEVGQSGMKVNRVELSPVAVTFYYGNQSEDESMVPLALAMKDGSLISLSERFNGGADMYNTMSKEYIVTRGLSQFIDTEAVEAIMFGNLTDEQMEDDAGGSVPARENMIEIKLNQ